MAKLYLTKDVANRFSISTTAVLMYTKKYSLGKKLGRDWFFTDEDLKVIATRVGKRGRPRKAT